MKLGQSTGGSERHPAGHGNSSARPVGCRSRGRARGVDGLQHMVFSRSHEGVGAAGLYFWGVSWEDGVSGGDHTPMRRQ